jgi:hypothetical protein
MNEATSVAEVLSTDCMEVSFPRHYTQKNFTHDAGRLRDILRLQTRQRLTEAELAEIVELRKRLKRIDGDVAMLLVVKTRLHGGFNLI